MTRNRRMRATSARRRAHSGGSRYDGTGYSVPKVEAPTLTLPEDDPEAVECVECHAFVKKLKNGTPRAHAPGGFTVAPGKGRYGCPGTGCLPTRADTRFSAPADASEFGGLPLYTEEQARERRLINSKIVGDLYGIQRTTVEGWARRGNFTPHVAYLLHAESNTMHKLFAIKDVEAFFAARGVRRKAG